MIGTYAELKKSMGYQPVIRSGERAILQGLDWRPVGAIIGLSGGLIAALMGSLLTAITWFTGTGVGSSYIHTLGTILLFLTIPLLICGAHCLDLAEKRKSEERKSRFHEN